MLRPAAMSSQSTDELRPRCLNSTEIVLKSIIVASTFRQRLRVVIVSKCNCFRSKMENRSHIVFSVCDYFTVVIRKLIQIGNCDVVMALLLIWEHQIIVAL